jgi:hypothetical protein
LQPPRQVSLSVRRTQRCPVNWNERMRVTIWCGSWSGTSESRLPSKGRGHTWRKSSNGLPGLGTSGGIELRPSGRLVIESQGTLQLTNGIRSTFRMEELIPGRNWKWAGRFLWMTVHYDHQFKKTGPEESEIRFVVDGEGFGAGVFGRVFAAIYARNLDRAIPSLVRELETP